MIFVAVQSAYSGFSVRRDAFTKDIAAASAFDQEANKIKHNYGCVGHFMDDNESRNDRNYAVGAVKPRGLSKEILCDLMQPGRSNFCSTSPTKPMEPRAQISSGVIFDGGVRWHAYGRDCRAGFRCPTRSDTWSQAISAG